eukprot:14047839-Ditylum_brightwellii.AAC.1
MESTILDSGTKWSVVGGSAWSIIKKYGKSLSMSAVDGNMKAVSMNLCDGVTAVPYLSHLSAPTNSTRPM